jgi:hypothetical protein
MLGQDTDTSGSGAQGEFLDEANRNKRKRDNDEVQVAYPQYRTRSIARQQRGL